MVSVLNMECDSDHAGCARTRKSTSGYIGMIGKHTVMFRAVTQSVIALSTAEAKFYALCSAMSAALGLLSLLADFGLEFKINIGMDASAAIAMASRKGLGRAKHLQCQYLWVQKLVSTKRGQSRRFTMTVIAVIS